MRKRREKQGGGGKQLFIGVLIAVVISVLLTDFDEKQVNCSNKHAAYAVLRQHISKEYNLSLYVDYPDIKDKNVKYSYLGKCRHYIKSFYIEGSGYNSISTEFEARILGYTNEGEWLVEDAIILD